jgi:hypothetical protein
MTALYQISGKPLPAALTSYDFLKAYAVILMIVDHVGYYFYPEAEYQWLRVIGRLCVPVWFFLIGYANSRDLGPKLWIGTAVLAAANVITGIAVLPLCILATMLFIRLVIDTVMVRALRDYEILAGIALIAVFATIPAGYLWEYGTSGLLFAMFGWFMRHKDQVNYKLKGVVEIFVLAFCVGAFGFLQALLFGFDNLQSGVLFAGLAAVCLMLYFFKSETYPRLTRVVPAPFVWIIQLLGRRTLEIYVLHLVAFKFAALLAGDPRFEWFRFDLLM